MRGWPEWGLPELGQLQLSWALPPSASAKPDVGWAGLGRSRILTSIVVAAEWPMPHSRFYRGGRRVADPAFSFLSWWPRNDRSPHSHFCRSGRGVADPRILTSIMVSSHTNWISGFLFNPPPNLHPQAKRIFTEFLKIFGGVLSIFAGVLMNFARVFKIFAGS